MIKWGIFEKIGGEGMDLFGFWRKMFETSIKANLAMNIPTL